MTPLSPKRRSELRSEAHNLSPVVMIGDKGLTDTVVAEVDRALKAHELIKVRAFTEDRKARREWFAQICERLDAHEVQQIGKVLVVYRENPQEKKPAPRPAAPRKASVILRKPRESVIPKARSRPTGTSRRQSRTPSPRPESGPRRRRRSTSQ